MHEVLNNINCPETRCFKSRNIELKINLHNTYDQFTVSNITTKKCNLKSLVMNKVIKDSSEKSQDAAKCRIKVRHTVSFVSDTSIYGSIKYKAKFIEAMYRYNTPSKDINAYNYQVHVKKFDYGRTVDVLLWYNKVMEIIKQKPCEDDQTKSTMTELLLYVYGLSFLLQLMITVFEKILVGDAQVPISITKESYSMIIIFNFKAT